MRAKLAALCTFVFAGAGICSAQTASPTQANYSTVYCSGFVTDQKVPDATRVVSAEQTNVKLIFSRGDYVTINRGQDKGVRVGDRYSVVRADTDPSAEVNWFKWQAKLMKAMGTHYLDAGHLRVVNVQDKDGNRGSDFILRLHATRRHRPPVSGKAGAGLSRMQPLLIILRQSAVSPWRWSFSPEIINSLSDRAAQSS